MVGKSQERYRLRSAGAGNGIGRVGRGRERQRAGNGVGHVECKAEYGKGPGAALSTWSASCQGESLKGYLGYPHGVVREPRAW